MLIVLDGMDCTGKTTLCAMLYDNLKDEIPSLAQMYFPKKTGIVEEFLNGNSNVSPFMFQSACFMQKFRFQNSEEFKSRNWIVDRWEPSGIVYGFSDMDNQDMEFKLNAFENTKHYSFSTLIKPDIGFILTVDPIIGTMRGIHRGKEVERYEDIEKQNVLFHLFESYVKKNPYYNYIDTTEYSLQNVFDEIYSKIKKYISI